ncbi:uncharacterized protein LOC120355277 [Nilaparvata lugens]|uniref:uncharacterized protein LOC120355277 n=1 Tax=Nilaparvata lugens TaxID=108931 RepID=UPI00193CAD0E|nr:uncharacterized protein LOC120355277 [Nilaparvata lugens]
MENSGYLHDSTNGFKPFSVNETDTNILNVPLRYLLGFAEDYRRIMLNVKQELVLRRAANNIDCLNTKGKIDIKRLEWRIPYIEVSDEAKLSLLKMVRDDTPIQMSFRHWELYEYPSVPSRTKHSWNVKTASHMENPRYIVVALQTARRGVATKNASHFDKCKVKDVRVYLNTRYFPYETIDGDDSRMYNMYTQFNGTYNHGDTRAGIPLLPKSALQKLPLFVFDCSRQTETLKTGSVDIRVDFEASENIPESTRAYCLMIYDVIKEYRPLTGTVHSV